jgi:ATP-dependent Lon protease
MLAALLARQVEVLTLSRRINAKVEDSLKRAQRQFYLRQRLRAIQEELAAEDGAGPGQRGPGQRGATGGSTFGAESQDAKPEVERLADALAAAGLPPGARALAEREMRRLRRMQPQQPEYHVLRSYLELVSTLPWNRLAADPDKGKAPVETPPPSALGRARAVLDADHCGLDTVKRRVIEYLAVCSLKRDMSAPILCLVGPPGVGKTSLGKSVARALGRPFCRIALGGVRDEAEIRGHRRTYVGAMPGRIVREINRCGVRNPVVLLDEVDKMGRDTRGDPSAALLEVLDPAQNHAFRDHYLGTPFDLGQVLFMATANSLSSISAPLLDRMELVRLSGYSWSEKMDIARRHLLPKQLAANGLAPGHLRMAPSVLLRLATAYTREAGVRQLERTIGAVCRSAAVRLAEWRSGAPERARMDVAQRPDGAAEEARLEEAPPAGGAPPAAPGPDPNAADGAADRAADGAAGGGALDPPALDPPAPRDAEAWCARDLALGFEPLEVDAAALAPILGPPKFDDDEQRNCAVGLVPGAVYGLAWTRAGGEMLVVEASILPRGSGRVRLTGQLGDVMKESAQTALSWIRSHASDPALLVPGGAVDVGSIDVHLHFPAAAVPKDGPSAGVAITTALVSALSGRCARRDVAMTGEVSLTGRVLPVGGIKEKLLAAHRSGARTVFLPAANERHLEGVPEDVRASMSCVLTSDVREVLEAAFHGGVGGDGDAADADARFWTAGAGGAGGGDAAGGDAASEGDAAAGTPGTQAAPALPRKGAGGSPRARDAAAELLASRL